MEVMYANKLSKFFKENLISGFYKDKIDLVDYLTEFYGITYDDEWTVKRFLNGLKIKVDEQILEYFKELNINENILNKKIKILSTNEYKLVLLIYILMMKPNIYIFDYFDIGLSYKYKRIFVNLLRTLKAKNKTIIVISNDIGFLYEVSDMIIIVENKKMIYNGNKKELFTVRRIKEYPPIIDFIRKSNKKGANLLYTMDTKELLKDIYRSLR